MGGGGKGGGQSMMWQQQAYNNALNAFQQGQPYQGVLGAQPGYEQAAQMAWQDYQMLRGGAGFGFHMPSFAMPHMPSYAQQLADRERQYGEQTRDALYGDYMSAANIATDYINAEIKDEAANAALLGIEYIMTDEMRNKRISDYFASIWSAGQQQRLEALIGEWGDPEGFAGYTIMRGDPDAYDKGVEGEEKSIATSKGIPPGTIITDPDEETLGKESYLGA